MKLNKQTREIMTNKIDLKILRTVLGGYYSLTDLAKEVGIAYKNLLPHVRKLEKEGWLRTKQDKNTRGQVIIVSSAKYETRKNEKVDQRWSDLFNGRTGKRAEKKIFEVVKELNKEATIESIAYLTDIRISGVWRNLLKGLLNKGYVQAKFEITKEGEEYFRELK